MKPTKEQFNKALTDLVSMYLREDNPFVDNPHIRVNPENLTIAAIDGEDFLSEIADSDEAIEDAAHAEGPQEDTADYQASQNPDFYLLKQFVTTKKGGFSVNAAAIAAVTDHYYELV